MNFAGLRQDVIDRLGTKVYRSALEYIQSIEPVLWGEDQPRRYLELNYVLTLRHLLHATGYGRTISFYDQKVKISEKSFRHNAQIFISFLGNWGDEHTPLGSLDIWRGKSRNVARSAAFKVKEIFIFFVQRSSSTQSHFIKDVCLWADSTDLPREHKRGSGRRRDNRWSFKLQHPGRRFITFRDATSKIRYVSDGYSPKIHDGGWLEINRREVNALFV